MAKEIITMATKKKIENWQKGLKATKVDEVLATLKDIGENGSEEIIPEIMELAVNAKSVQVKRESNLILQNIKINGAEPHFFNAFKNKNYQNHLEELLSAFWHSNLDASGNLQTLIDLALKADDYMIGFECLTIIENNKTQFKEEELIEAIKNIQMYLEMGHPQLELLQNIKETLSDLLTDR